MAEKPLRTPDIPPNSAVDADEGITEIEVVLEGEGEVEVEEEAEAEAEAAKFDDNIAIGMDDNAKGVLASELIRLFDEDKLSRADWEKQLSRGIKYLGLTMDQVSEPWEGAAGVIHPLMAEAVVRFQSNTILEIFPAQGPVRSKIPGKQTPERIKRGTRVAEYMNYQLTEVMEEYRPETERMLWGLGLSGCSLRKLYFDPTTGRTTSAYVESIDFVVPFATKSLASAERYTHIMHLSKNEVKRLQYVGLYDKDVDLGSPTSSVSAGGDVERETEKVTGHKPPASHEDYTILEMYTLLNIDGHEEGGGIAVPYVVTICKETSHVLSIYRNWEEGEEYYNPVSYFVDYHYIPGPGWYGLGFAHLIGGIASSSTGILRQLLDAGTLANIPGGFKTKGLRIVGGDDLTVAPGMWVDVDVYSGSIKDNILPLPYKEPSAVLHALMQDLLDEGREFASLAELKVSDMGSGTPVGTVMAIIERQLKVMNAVHARIFVGMKSEFKILKRLFGEFGPWEYPYEVDEDKKILKDDFTDKGVDIIPVADPNAGTMAQRVVRLQAAMDTASRNPEIYDMPKLHRQMQEALGAKDLDEIIPTEAEIKMMDPVTENMAILTGKPVKVFPFQDQDAHMTVHMAMAQDPHMQEVIAQSPNAASVGMAMMSHVIEHLSHSYRDALEAELGAELPPLGEPLPPEIEKRLSRLVADAASRLFNKTILESEVREIKEKLEDPVVRQKDRELDIKADANRNRAKLDALQIELEIRKSESEDIRLSREAIDAEEKHHMDKVVDLIKASMDYGARMQQVGSSDAQAVAKAGVELEKVARKHVEFGSGQDGNG